LVAVHIVMPRHDRHRSTRHLRLSHHLALQCFRIPPTPRRARLLLSIHYAGSGHLFRLLLRHPLIIALIRAHRQAFLTERLRSASVLTGCATHRHLAGGAEAHARPVHANHTARPPLTHREPASQMSHRLAASSRRHHFFRAGPSTRRCRVSPLPTAVSAWRFSASSARNRFALLTSSPHICSSRYKTSHRSCRACGTATQLVSWPPAPSGFP
jgi:hypothetical protein